MEETAPAHGQIPSLTVDEDIIEFYRKKGRLGYVNITIHGIEWKRQLYGTRSSSNASELVTQIKIFPSKSSQRMTNSTTSRHKRCKALQAGDLILDSGDSIMVGNDELSKGSLSFEWKTWINCQFQLLVFLPNNHHHQNHTNNTNHNTCHHNNHHNSHQNNHFTASPSLPSSASSLASQSGRALSGRRPRFLLSDAITVTPSSHQQKHLLFAKSFDLLDATITLSMTFYPNDLSFSFICIASEASHQNSYFIKTLDQLKRIALKKKLKKEKEKEKASKVDRELFLLSVQYLKERAEQPEDLLASLFPSTDTNNTKQQRLSSAGTPIRLLSRTQSLSVTGSKDTSPAQQRIVTSNAHQQQHKIESAVSSLMRQTYESHVVANAAKKFLSELEKNLSYSPKVDIFLVEQMLSIYQFVLSDVLHHHNTPPSAHLTPSSHSHPSSSHHSPAPASALPSFTFHRHQVTHFLVACGIWILQQSLLAADLCSKLNVMKEELSSLRQRFLRYDNHLSNEITTSDFCLLLQDVGSYYEEDELETIVRSLDSDDMGIIEFPQFISWWIQ